MKLVFDGKIGKYLGKQEWSERKIYHPDGVLYAKMVPAGAIVVKSEELIGKSYMEGPWVIASISNDVVKLGYGDDCDAWEIESGIDLSSLVIDPSQFAKQSNVSWSADSKHWHDAGEATEFLVGDMISDRQTGLYIGNFVEENDGICAIGMAGGGIAKFYTDDLVLFDNQYKAHIADKKKPSKLEVLNKLLDYLDYSIDCAGFHVVVDIGKDRKDALSYAERAEIEYSQNIMKRVYKWLVKMGRKMSPEFKKWYDENCK